MNTVVTVTLLSQKQDLRAMFEMVAQPLIGHEPPVQDDGIAGYDPQMTVWISTSIAF